MKPPCLVLVVTCVLISVMMPLQATAGKPETEIVVAAAASLTDVVADLVARFEADQEGVRVRVSLAATGTLVRQIEQGAPVDVLITASYSDIEGLDSAGLLEPGHQYHLCSNTVTLVVRPGLHLSEGSGFDALRDKRIASVALGDPSSVPAGRYALDILRQLDLYESVRPKMVYANSVRQALLWAETSQVDAAMVYETDARSSKDVIPVASSIPGDPEIEYGIALIKGAGTKAAALRFIEFALGEEAGELLRNYGFEVPER